MPAILRRLPTREANFSVVGHAYVDQVMQGERWGAINLQDLSEVLIH